MKPEEKAKKLIDKFKPIAHKYNTAFPSDEPAKQCAAICVQEIIEVQSDFYGLVLTEPFRQRCLQRVEYWQSVLTSIQKQ